MTIAFICDYCEKVMKYEDDRYSVIGHLDKYGMPIHFCAKCVNILDDFIKQREQEDMDTSLRFKRVNRK